MKDDRILNPRLRLCPFCGAAGMPELITSGGVAFVSCKVCKADGPVFAIGDYLRDDFHDMSASDQDMEWGDATVAAMHNAMKAWNYRPWEGSYWPADLEKIDAKMEQEVDV